MILPNEGRKVKEEASLTYPGRRTIFRGASRSKKEDMFGSIGLPEMLLILAIALIVFGPKKLPEVGRSLGRALREFKKSTEEIKSKLEEQINAEEFKNIQDDIKDIKKDLNGDEEGKKIS